MVKISHSFTQIKSNLYYQNSRGDSKNTEPIADTWNHYLQSLHEAIAESNTAKEIIQKDYDRLQALAMAWEKEIQIALKNSCEDRVRQALAHKQNCTARARELKTLIERHVIHVTTLQIRLIYWRNQAT
ncbi:MULTISPECIES: PspA/IM30 family protein [Nostoc]|uniref:Uncharacterized protein n=1 Tax=Nostoc paludosum FACHB-159 TaxID=2692908 RepID=A0ABR8KDA7_9NOSO|nr:MULTISPECIES: hypothetical protein [Nostoc]MBD2681044.1 hypothetical protein [Nostoc sp. FACHB-857]MBD2737518.1 hypothetical protein [Nostoc paludosum FACHB-159]